MEVAELVQGDVMFHTLYASLLADSEARVENEALVPHWLGRPAGLERVLSAGYRKHKQQPGAALQFQLSYTVSLPPPDYWPLHCSVSKVPHCH